MNIVNHESLKPHLDPAVLNSLKDLFLSPQPTPRQAENINPTSIATARPIDNTNLPDTNRISTLLNTLDDPKGPSQISNPSGKDSAEASSSGMTRTQQ